MDIRNRKELTDFAAQRLGNSPMGGKIALIFAAVTVGLSLLSTVGSYVLELGMENAGGLSNLGTRSMISALRAMLPLIQSVVLMCLELGYMASMLRTARGQYTSANTLRLGFDRFWTLLRYTIMESLILVGIGFASTYFGVMLFIMTPLSKDVMAILMPLASQSSLLDPSIVIPDTLLDPLMEAMLPAYIICGVIFLIAALPILYRLRMSKFVIIDKPAFGALRAMHESRKMTHRNCMHLFKLDLHLWWYYAATILATVIAYGDQLLPMLGISLPFSGEVSYYLFYGLYLAAEFAILYLLRNYVETAYALAYDALRPREQPTDGVVLGNIFQM